MNPIQGNQENNALEGAFKRAKITANTAVAMYLEGTTSVPLIAGNLVALYGVEKMAGMLARALHPDNAILRWACNLTAIHLAGAQIYNATTGGSYSQVLGISIASSIGVELASKAVNSGVSRVFSLVQSSLHTAH